MKNENIIVGKRALVMDIFSALSYEIKSIDTEKSLVELSRENETTTLYANRLITEGMKVSIDLLLLSDNNKIITTIKEIQTDYIVCDDMSTIDINKIDFITVIKDDFNDEPMNISMEYILCATDENNNEVEIHKGDEIKIIKPDGKTAVYVIEDIGLIKIDFKYISGDDINFDVEDDDLTIIKDDIVMNISPILNPLVTNFVINVNNNTFKCEDVLNVKLTCGNLLVGRLADCTENSITLDCSTNYHSSIHELEYDEICKIEIVK